jgi:hypothetical protein
VFVERGSGVDRQIAAIERPHGTLEFTSASGPAGIRQIVAIATVNDQPVIFNPHASEPGVLVVARYQAAGPTRLGAVRKLRARRQGTHLLVSFARVRGAKCYAVLIALRDGLRTDYVITRASLNVVIPTVAPLAGRVIVRALGTTSRPPTVGGGHEHRGPAVAAEAPHAPSSLSTGSEPGEVLRFAFALLDLPVEQRTSLREQQLVR